MAYPHHVFKAPFGLCDWTITAMVNLLSMGASTFLVYWHAYMLFNLSLWLHQEVCRWSQWRWAKQLTLSWQNGFHHSMCIMPLICLTRQWRASVPMTAVSSFIRIQELLEWNEKPQTLHHLFPPPKFHLVWGAKILFPKVITGSCEICVYSFNVNLLSR